MAVVGFDTATADTAVCAMRGGKVLHEELLGLAPGGSPRHSTALLAEVERAAEAAGGWDSVERLAVGLGPGSFVGIRIGIATARGLAASTGLPVTGVCTLDALGRALGDLAGPERDRLAVLDARRGEVFAALYSPAGERLWEPLVAAPDELVERVAGLPAAPLAAGSGAVRFRNELASRGADVPEDADPVHRVAARHVCALAEAAPERGDERLEPIYLRAPDAERWRERDTSKRVK
ncbi:MAG TPA: tRNA (adenosine(37)-N6)-threonylcarbamoyltransferase complex dimerization subunit type 1 TsaB [Solirubrobacterales bacterium]|jgi:tRNA threonylcarbamoyladenosine biosynthesis protein TsaB|nr:tRNA (adenosine(37)-N6)-threonylcarbamoyltransferase complex dimerization subunit type 1 TsaB [Solirubrobacterales bacterium]